MDSNSYYWDKVLQVILVVISWPGISAWGTVGDGGSKETQLRPLSPKLDSISMFDPLVNNQRLYVWLQKGLRVGGDETTSKKEAFCVRCVGTHVIGDIRVPREEDHKRCLNVMTWNKSHFGSKFKQGIQGFFFQHSTFFLIYPIIKEKK